MIVYRLCSEKYKHDISGEGARKQTSNRWNSFGTPLFYTSESLALCAVELSKLVHPSFIPLNYQVLEIYVPDVIPLEIEGQFYDGNWLEQVSLSQKLGDFFVRDDDYLVLKVPSAWIQNCFNYLINPKHSAFSQVRIERAYPFEFKGKLFF